MASLRDLRFEIKEAGEVLDYWKAQRLTDNQRALLDAVRKRNLEKVKRLLGKGTDPNFKDDSNVHLLHIITEMHQQQGVTKDILSTVLYFGCDMNVRDRFGLTALHLASRKNAEYTQLLLNSGCAVNTQDNAGRTALMEACSSEHEQAPAIVQLLLDHGASTSLHDQVGFTALHCICKSKQCVNQCRDIVDKLLQAGTSTTVTDNHGKMAVCYELDKLVNSSRRTYNTGHFSVVMKIVEAGANFESKDKLHLFWVRYAINYSNTQFLKMLLDCMLPVLSLSSLKKLRQLCHLIENDDQDITRTLQAWITTPTTLKSLCRIAIRNELKGEILSKSQPLPIPTYLKKYLVLAA